MKNETHFLNSFNDLKSYDKIIFIDRIDQLLIQTKIYLLFNKNNIVIVGDKGSIIDKKFSKIITFILFLL